MLNCPVLWSDVDLKAYFLTYNLARIPAFVAFYSKSASVYKAGCSLLNFGSLTGRHFNRSLDRLGLARGGVKKKFTPVDVRGSQKFSGKNSFFRRTFPNSVIPVVANIPDTSVNKTISENIRTVLSMGLSDSSWSKYKTSLNHLKRVEAETGVSMSLPLSDEKLLWFISYMDSQRNVESKTIDNYISGLRMLHISLGIHIPALRSPIVKLAIKGIDRRQKLKDELRSKKRRRAVTLPVLEYICHQIAADLSVRFR